ncbi:DUF402 domain-containing protein [Streptomyces sp. NPDC001820]|uniref:DUF402 domain-containing protein n=1 Tax=Streptomyces sp. NPDC001820 TaxID=3364613 RepID=UPI00368CE792
MRTEAFEAMATGEWELAPGRWQDTELLLWKPPAAWFSINAFYTGAGLRNWYVNFEHPTRRTEDGFDTFDLTVLCRAGAGCDRCGCGGGCCRILVLPGPGADALEE